MNTLGFLVAISTFTIVMLAIAWRSKHDNTINTFFAAGRNVGVLGVAISTAASWQWADNLFSTSQIGFDYGVYGIAWFAVTTVLSFVLFAFMAEKIRSQATRALTIPEFVAHKTDQSRAVHISLVIAITLYQLGALALGATATGLLLNSAFGFNYVMASSSVILFALTYSLISGLKASVVTDAIQFVMMLALMVFMISAMVIGLPAGTEIGPQVLFGSNSEITSFFNSRLVIELGIPLAIIILAQPIVDQMIYQRLVAFRLSGHPLKPFLLTGAICGFIVILFSGVGILGQVLSQQGLITVTDSQLTMVEAVRFSLSDVGLTLFVLAFLGSVFSTTDSVYSSVSSLISIDVYKRYFGQNRSEKEILTVGRISMLVAAAIAIAVSLAKLEILWMLFIIGAAGGTVVMPVAFSVYARLTPSIVVTSVLLSLIVSVPLSIYGNVVGNSLLVSAASLAGIGIGALLCGYDVLQQRYRRV